MPSPPVSTPWLDRVAATLHRYQEGLVREVASRLVRPRNQWPVDELISRCLDTLQNAPVLDRRLDDLAPSSRQVLALIGHSRQPIWSLGNLVEMVIALGQEDGLEPIVDLLGAGLLYPALETVAPGSSAGQLPTFAQWFGIAGTGGLNVFCPPQVASRAIGIDLGLPDLSVEAVGADAALGDGMLAPTAPVLEADGLEWPLRLAVLWQMVGQAPLRRTMQGGLFKRDVDRLSQEQLLTSPPLESLATPPDLGFLLAALGETIGLLTETDGELRAAALPPAWEAGLWPTLEDLYVALFRMGTWSPLEGWRGGEPIAGNPYPSAYLLLFLLLARLPEQKWMAPALLENWIQAQHPYWNTESVRPSRQKPWVETFLLGLAHPLRLIQATRGADGGTVVRLTPLARHLLGLREAPPTTSVYPKTLMVQPNLEIIAYRQGLTPALLVKLTRIARWKTLGAACLLQLEPETVYRALEQGESFDSICRVLEQHGTRATPQAVLDLLRTWSNKRDRITVFPAAALLEFASAADLSEALARGLPGIRLSDTLAAVASEDQIEFRHFRLAGTRDYALPPERCVSVEEDGVTLTVDLSRSDLMLETELPRFAELVDRSGANGKRQYRLTPASLSRARTEGMSLTSLETWFQQRTGEEVSPAARLLLTGGQLDAPRLRRHLVLHVGLPEIAEGLLQWPGTSELIAERLGPTSLSIAEEQVAALQARLGELGIHWQAE
ncbi:MAG: helicase-associated domain-containing protein [Gemmataceae bacterium]